MLYDELSKLHPRFTLFCEQFGIHFMFAMSLVIDLVVTIVGDTLKFVCIKMR